MLLMVLFYPVMYHCTTGTHLVYPYFLLVKLPIFKAMDRFGIDKPDLRYDMETLGIVDAWILGLGSLVA